MNQIASHQRLDKGRGQVITSKVLQIVITVAGIGLITLFLLTALHQTRADGITKAVRASFPDFCQGGQILAEVYPLDGSGLGRYWEIRCDDWAKGPGAYYGYATIIDTEQCTTLLLPHGIVPTLGKYFDQITTLNSSNGKRMAVCP